MSVMGIAKIGRSGAFFWISWTASRILIKDLRGTKEIGRRLSSKVGIVFIRIIRKEYKAAQ